MKKISTLVLIVFTIFSAQAQLTGTADKSIEVSNTQTVPVKNGKVTFEETIVAQGYTAEQVKELISAHEKAGWEFHFLAANIDAVSTARGLGIRRGRAMRFDATPDGMREGFACMARIIESEKKENEND